MPIFTHATYVNAHVRMCPYAVPGGNIARAKLHPMLDLYEHVLSSIGLSHVVLS